MNKGEADALVEKWTAYPASGLPKPWLHRLAMKRNLKAICREFAAIEVKKTPKIKVGIVGEIYIVRPARQQ